MSSFNGWGWYKRAAKRPPPAHGIKVKKAGTTWWGQRWIEALESVLRGDSARLGRGRTYARAGRTHDLAVQGGVVTAKVTGSRPTPYKITIKLAQLPDAAWKVAIAGMAEKAQFAAELLSGQMPKEIDEVFRAAKTSLFPLQRADLTTSCSCPDWGDPCKHVAATHYVLGEALDRDPFLLFELRGRTKDQVLAALRAARAADGEGSAARVTSKKRPEVSEVEIPRVPLTKLMPGDYDRPRETLPALHFSFDPPTTDGAVLRQLGTPPAWSGARTPVEALSGLVRAAAERARRIAMAEPADSDTLDRPDGQDGPHEPDKPDKPDKPGKPKASTPNTKRRASSSRGNTGDSRAAPAGSRSAPSTARPGPKRSAKVRAGRIGG